MKEFRNWIAGILLSASTLFSLNSCVPGTEQIFIQAVVYATEMFITSTVAELVERGVDGLVTGLFNLVIKETPNKIDIIPYDNNPMLGRKVGDHNLIVKGFRNSAGTIATIVIPTELIFFERMSEGSEWVFTKESEELIRERLEMASIQLSLQSLNYDPSRVDGIIGKNTKKAIRAFQKVNGIQPANGEVDSYTRSLLLKI